MSNDPAFLFYPGDYLRDTQCLSEKAQVAYDRIICEHMRNICIRQQQLNFFIKRLSDDEKEELMLVLTKVNGGYQIKWVAESILKRRAYSKSRRENREHKNKKDMLTYDGHMENVIENAIKKEDDIVKECLKNKLDKMAKVEVVIKVLEKVTPKMRWVVDKFLKEKFPADGHKVYSKAEECLTSKP